MFELGTRRPDPGVRYTVESLGYDYGDIAWTRKGKSNLERYREIADHQRMVYGGFDVIADPRS